MTTADAPASRRRADRRLYDFALMAAAVVAAGGAAVASVAWPLVVVLIAAVGIFSAVVLRRPDSATLIVLILLYSNAPVVAMRHHGLPSAVALAFPLLLLAPLAYHTLVRHQPLRLGIAGPILIALAVAHLASATMAGDWSTTMATTASFLTNGVALYLLTVNVLRSEVQIRRAALVLVGIAASLGAAAFLHTLLSDWPGVRVLGFSELRRGDLLVQVDWEQYFSTAYPDAELRAAGPIGEANFFAFILLMTVPYALALLFAPHDRLERIVALLALPWLAVGILITYSRGAGIAVALVTVLLAVRGLIPRRTLLALAGAATVALVAAPDYAQRLVRLTAAPRLFFGGSRAAVGDEALSGRYSEMVSAAHAWADHPILGLGPGLFPDNYQRYARELGFTVHEGPREAHNLYLHFAAELGTVGLTLVVGLLFLTLRHLLAAHRSAWDAPSRAFTVAGISVIGIIAVNAMFLHLAFERYLWLHVAIIAAWCAETRRRSARHPLDVASLEPSSAAEAAR